MKYGMVILGGAAGEPLAELDGRTPLQAAATPNLDALAARGRIGAVAATPAEMEPDAGVCRMALLGGEPHDEYPGRAVLDAAGLGVTLSESEWALRLDLLCAGEEGGEEEGVLLGAARGLSSADESELIGAALAHVREVDPGLLERVRVELPGGPGGGAVLIDGSGRDYSDVETVCPETLAGQEWERHMPASGRRGAAPAEKLVRLMELAAEALEAHPLNVQRREAGEPPVNMAWVWGAGKGGAPVAPFAERHKVSAALLGEDTVSLGLGRLLGMRAERWNWREGAEAMAEELERVDLLCLAPEVGRLREESVRVRVEAIQEADARIIGPLARAMERYGDPEQDESAPGWRLLVVADRFLTTKVADATPTPLLLAGAWVRSLVQRRFNEHEAISSDLKIEPGHELMEFFLRGGMVDKRPRRRVE